MKTITLDFTGCILPVDMHEVIKVAFDFPFWYGRNWSAFWDLLREPNYPTMVEVRGLSSLSDLLKPSGEMVIEILQRKKEHEQHFMETLPQFDYQFDYTVID